MAGSVKRLEATTKVLHEGIYRPREKYYGHQEHETIKVLNNKINLVRVHRLFLSFTSLKNNWTQKNLFLLRNDDIGLH